MSQEFEAIFEHGVLRPTTPLNLPESAVVTGIVRTKLDQQQDELLQLRSQQNALDAMFQEVDKLPQNGVNDGLSGRDHDQILYGSHQ